MWGSDPQGELSSGFAVSLYLQTHRAGAGCTGSVLRSVQDCGAGMGAREAALLPPDTMRCPSTVLSCPAPLLELPQFTLCLSSQLCAAQGPHPALSERQSEQPGLGMAVAERGHRGRLSQLYPAG